MDQIIQLIPIITLVAGIPGIFILDAALNHKERSEGEDDNSDIYDDCRDHTGLGA